MNSQPPKQGTFTPLHTDTLNSFSWSASIAGRKRWWMLPPEAGPFLRDNKVRSRVCVCVCVCMCMCVCACACVWCVCVCGAKV